MTELNLIKGLFFKIYTDKNVKVFKEALSLLNEDGVKDGIFGFIYSDKNIKEEIVVNFLEKNPRMTIFKVIDMNKTNSMDNKLEFYKKMKDSKYSPISFRNIEELKNNSFYQSYLQNNDLFFLKDPNTTLSKGVKVFKLKDLSDLTFKENQIIQKSMVNPALINNRRFKLRILVVIYKENVYFHKKYWGSISKIEFNNNEDDKERLKLMNVITFDNGDPFFIDDIPHLNNINNEIMNSLKDIKKYYSEEINNIKENLYTILGIDYVISVNGSVEVVEINHRPNFWHEEYITKNSDIKCIKDLYKLLINDSCFDTDFILIQ
jgi:hypothetical protein